MTDEYLQSLHKDVDNFGVLVLMHLMDLVEHKLSAHIGGFVMGLLVGTFFYPVISETKRHRIIMWCFRLAAVPLAVILFVSLTRNFYTSDPYAGKSVFRILSHILLNDCSLFWMSISVLYSIVCK